MPRDARPTGFFQISSSMFVDKCLNPHFPDGAFELDSVDSD
jgi:hypothetical protein